MFWPRKSGQPLARYFPDVVDAIRRVKAKRFVLDGEIVIPDPAEKTLSFDALLQRLHHVGFCSGLKAAERPALTKKLEALIAPPGFTGRAPGGPSRWSTRRSSEWQPLKPKLVVEVQFDHVSGGRFRHGTTLLRWRPDKAPRQCTLEQLKQKRSRAGAVEGVTKPCGRGALTPQARRIFAG